MVKVAVAGGSGSLGRAIVDVLKESPHEAVILSRTEDSIRAAEIGVPIVAIDYDNIEAMTKVLEEKGVHTIISTLPMRDDSTDLTQQNLIRAAEKSAATNRFVPSEWGRPWTEQSERIWPSMANRRRAHAILKNETKLEYVLFNPGIFMDYFGTPKLRSYVKPLSLVIDIAHRTAALPGDGNNKVDFSYTYDIAQYVVRYLDVPEGQWEESVLVSSDKKSFKEVVEICEKVTGEKFNVTYDDLEKLERKEVTELPSYVPMYAFFPKEVLLPILAAMKTMFATDEWDLDTSKAINGRYPDIRPKLVEDVIREGWGN